MTRPLLLALTLAGAALAAPALAQTRDEIRQEQEQLYQQQQLQQQQQNYANPTAPPLGGGDTEASPPGRGGLTTQLLDRVSRLEDEVRTLRGRVDEQQNELQTQSAALNKQIGDLNFAMQQGHGAPSPGAPASAPVPIPTPAPPPNIHRTPEAALRQANAALARHDYTGAADLAREAVGAGSGVHSSQAQYVLGEALAGQGNNGGAAAAYYGAYTKQPHGPFAPDALLHVGSSLIATGDDNAACEALGQLRANFPAARPGLVKQAAFLRTRAHCH